MINSIIMHIFISRIPYQFLHTFYEQVGLTCKSGNNFGHLVALWFWYQAYSTANSDHQELAVQMACYAMPWWPPWPAKMA